MVSRFFNNLLRFIQMFPHCTCSIFDYRGTLENENSLSNFRLETKKLPALINFTIFNLWKPETKKVKHFYVDGII